MVFPVVVSSGRFDFSCCFRCIVVCCCWTQWYALELIRVRVITLQTNWDAVSISPSLSPLSGYTFARNGPGITVVICVHTEVPWPGQVGHKWSLQGWYDESLIIRETRGRLNYTWHCLWSRRRRIYKNKYIHWRSIALLTSRRIKFLNNWKDSNSLRDHIPI